MANPNDAVGTNGAFGGRTSVNAFNDVLSAFSGRGIISGWACAPSSGLTVTLGGNGTDRDVAIAEDASGNKTTINNISQSPVAVTVNAASASNSRIDSIVAYIEDSPNGSGITDNPDVVNLLVVSGSVASTPVAPNDSAIRSAITSDGASGSTAYYVVLANITIPTGTTDIDSTMISAGSKVQLASNYIPDGAITADKLASSAVTAEKINFATMPGNFSDSETSTQYTWIDGKTIYKKTIGIGSLPNSGTSSTNTGLSGVDKIVRIDGIGIESSGLAFPLPMPGNTFVELWYDKASNRLNCQTGGDRSAATGYVNLYYTKN